MSLRIGLYDFFAYTLPGVLYILVITYGLNLFGFVNIDLSLFSNLSLFSFLILVGTGYIVGLLLEPLTQRWGLLFHRRVGKIEDAAYNEFHKQHSWLELNFNSDDWPLLLFAIKNRSIEQATDIELFNVYSKMLRSISLALLLASVIFLLFFFTISANVWNLVLVAVAFYFSIVAIKRSGWRKYSFYRGIFQAFVGYYLFQEKLVGGKSYVSIRKYDDEVQDLDTVPGKKKEQVPHYE